jgi:hypothetical protein
MLLPKALPLLGFSYSSKEKAFLNPADDTHITKALRAYPTPKRNQIINLVIEAVDRATDVIAASHNLKSYNLSLAIEIARQGNGETAAWTAKVDPAVFRSFLLTLRSTRIKALNRASRARVMPGSNAAKLANAVDWFTLEVERRGWGKGLTVSLLPEKGGENTNIEEDSFDLSAPFKLDKNEEEKLVKAVQKMSVRDIDMEADVIMG